MVADCSDECAVGNRDLMDMRCKNDELASIRHDRFKLVHAFASHPELIVHQRRTREHGVEGVFLVRYMERPGQIARLLPGVLRRAGKKSCQLSVIYYHTKTELRYRHHRGG